MKVLLIISYICVIIFGLGTWLSINSLYTQLPLLVDIVPESWNFATYLVTVLQGICLLSIVYAYFASKSSKLKQGNIPATIILIFLNAGALLMAAFVYPNTVIIGGEEHSVYLLIAIALMSIPCTLSDVIYLPFISRFRNNNLVVAFFLGMGLSALVPSVTTFVQGTITTKNITETIILSNGNLENITKLVTEEPLFGVQQFLIGISILSLLPLLAFIVLLKVHEKEKELEVKSPDWPHPGITSRYVDNSLSKGMFLSYLILVSIIGALQNSIVPCIIPYSTSRFGANIYHITNTLFVMINPFFCFLPFVIKIRKFIYHLGIFLINISAFTVLFLYAYIPKLQKTDNWFSHAILYIATGILSGFLSWQRAGIGETLRKASKKSGLFWCGTFIQIGSCIGAITSILITNVFNIFES
ncbi:Solute carrier family 52, riboflavin transporter, member 3 [Strongyloides ratti]|uniref:Riboflavin transporter n=1 Tax=Strongyloides ratti TaxID=34506 RepID=A0A090MZB1_STRRB|nr:Solute carrier family 52, riboflavin transporter, member 3 [Strongyloides ratti]CEF68624.1 Solute carrier family 52, riboflavin transporter, member 3 [Strongyloides ratti]